jgi:hypothetical protein
MFSRELTPLSPLPPTNPREVRNVAAHTRSRPSTLYARPPAPQAACEWVHAQAAAAHAAKVLPLAAGNGGGGSGGGPAIPSRSEFGLRTNLALEASLRRLHSFAFATQKVPFDSPSSQACSQDGRQTDRQTLKRV